MSFRVIIQLVLASILLLFSTGVAWYEGSALLEHSWEWKHTALFSGIVNGQLENANDILSIDYFMYAAKFAPVFPLLMLLSGTYLIILLGYSLLKRNHKVFTYYLASISVLFLVLGGFLSNSPTSGLKIIFAILLFIGILFLVTALVRLVNNKVKEIS
ncbi:YjdJ family protein [Sporosarcina psychrophila]|uniref:YjdJ family protein n=1 Tax=Sporosarcina psychrophila TaxID=1476 RepID=UPI00078E6DD9|nr:YjdJ family protein [Sporosarcina psychrophila]AMQ05556.1 hypothetical protein AZE41_06290 [Sporosarcina psychrophila]